MLLDLGKALSFFLSILSLYPVVMSAFFVPGMGWEDRLATSLMRIGMAGCICFASGLLFCREEKIDRGLEDALMSTLPVRIFFWTVAGVAVLFVVSWYLEAYYVPLMWRNQPHEIGAMLKLAGF